MKKILVSLILLMFLTGCQKGPDLTKPFELTTYKCDMSGYEGLKSTGHRFLGTTVSELERTINEKGYGAFVLSRTNCDHCQMIMQYLNEVCEELDIYLYYIDGVSSIYPIIGTSDYELLYDLLYTTLNEGDEGKELQTPEVFTIVDGTITNFKVGTTWKGSNYDQDDIDELKSLYRKMLTPFSS